jgi:hypothetical protein
MDIHDRFAFSRGTLAAHVKENAIALSLPLTPQELQTLDAAFPLHKRQTSKIFDSESHASQSIAPKVNGLLLSISFRSH